jgi:hypothetical protein
LIMATTTSIETRRPARGRVRGSTKGWFVAVAALLATAVFFCGWDLPRAAEPPGDSVRITFTTVPSAKAMVFWGKKRLGIVAPHQPLIVQRPRDSGPLDVIVRAAGYLPVQTRAYTFADSKVAVKLTPPDQKKTLLGYREAPPDAGAPPPASADNGAPDGGAPR